MMKTTAKTMLMGMAMILGMASCGNDDIVPPGESETADGLDALDMELTYTVGDQQDEPGATNGAKHAKVMPTTEKQIFMGMEVEISVSEDRHAPKAAAKGQRRATTVYNTVNLEGKTVYAAVFNPTTKKSIAALQTLTVTGGKITVRGKRGHKILFYIGNRPSVNVGTDVSTAEIYQANGHDPMYCMSDVITTPDQNLGMLSFKHSFTKVRMVMKTSNGTDVNAFSAELLKHRYGSVYESNVNNAGANVNIFDGSYTISGSASSFYFSKSGNSTHVAESEYMTFVSQNADVASDYALRFENHGKGATIGGARNWLTNFNNMIVLKNKTFLPGHRYSINITVRPSDTDQYLNSGYRNDKRYYQWDAYEPYGVGDQRSWSPGNSGGRFGSYFAADPTDAKQSAKNCPSYDEMKMYIGAGVYIDRGHTGANQQSYTITDPDTGEKTTYHAGVWLKKKQYIPGFDAGTAPKAESYTSTGSSTRPPQSDIDKYFFLPLTGFYDITNFASTHRRLLYAGESGYFMSRTAISGTHYRNLKISENGVSFIGLNWTSNNLAASTIWTAD